MDKNVNLDSILFEIRNTLKNNPSNFFFDSTLSVHFDKLGVPLADQEWYERNLIQQGVLIRYPGGLGKGDTFDDFPGFVRPLKNNILKRHLTIADEDHLLDILVESANVGEDYLRADYSSVVQQANLTDKEFHALLEYFDRRGLVKYNGTIHYGQKTFNFTLNREAERFKAIGGFSGEHEIIKNQLEKLRLEIEKLSESDGQGLANAVTIFTGLQTFIMAAFSRP